MKKILKIVAGFVALALIAGVLFVTDAFVGNPISAALANRAIAKYVEIKYPDFDLELDKAAYNFKDSAYAAMAKSNISIDTRFYVYYRNGRVIRDDYESYVLEYFNTLNRLSKEYSVLAKNILAKEMDIENESYVVVTTEDTSALELDMKFDRNLPVESELVIRVTLESNSIEDIADILTEAHRVFLDNDCKFDKYSLYSENSDGNVSVNGILPADIENGNLTEILKKSIENDGNVYFY